MVTGPAGGEGGQDRVSRAEAHLEAARRAVAEYRTEDAAVALRAAAQLAGPPGTERDQGDPESQGDRARWRTLRLRLRLTGAWVVFEQEGPVTAAAELTTLRADALEQGCRDVAASCDVQLGLVRGRSGDLAGALRAMREAETLRSALPAADQVRLLLNRGALASQTGDLASARADLAAAVTGAGLADMPELVFMGLHNQGYVQFLQGDLPGALHSMQQAQAVPVDVDRGVALLDRARVMLEAGLLEEARHSLLEAGRLTEAAGGRHDLGEIGLDLARAEMLLGDPAGAADRARAARRLFHRRGEAGWRRVALAVQLEADALAGTPPGPRARLAGALEADAVAAGEDRMAARAALLRAEALVDQGETEGAGSTLVRAGQLLDSPHLAVRLHAHYVGARLDSAQGRLPDAAATLARAARDLAGAQREAPGLDVRTALAVHGDRLMDLDLGLALRSGSADLVLARTEMWRDVVRALPRVREDEDPVRSGLVGRLRGLREELRTASPGADTAVVRARVSETERSLREVGWSTAGAGWSPDHADPLTGAQVGEAMRATGTTLVSGVVIAGRLCAVRVAADGDRTLHDLADPAEVQSLVRRVLGDLAALARVPPRSPLHGVVRTSLEHGLDRLDHLLLAPLRVPGRVPLVVVPTPALMGVPWGMLPSRRGEPTTVSRSATAWVSRRTEPSREPVVTALAGPDVPLADEEVRAVVQAWGAGRAVVSARSRAADLVPALGVSDLVHVAAHGEHHARNPVFSGLRLGDGVVAAHEMEGRPLRAGHVVLSACDGGRVSARRGEEPLGLTVALLALGVCTVVAPVSVVPDEVAHATMTRYHAELAAGAEAAHALARATGEGDLLAASFTCFGSTWRRA